MAYGKHTAGKKIGTVATAFALGAITLIGAAADRRYAEWRSLPNGKLRRVQRDPQSTRTMTVTLLANNTCRLDVVDRLKPGFTEYEFLRISDHTMAFFSTYRVVDTSCRIRS
jgi:hypothetical protein